MEKKQGVIEKVNFHSDIYPFSIVNELAQKYRYRGISNPKKKGRASVITIRGNNRNYCLLVRGEFCNHLLLAIKKKRSE